MTELEARNQLVSCCRRLYEKGFFPGKDGNVSVRAGDNVLITPTGVSKAVLSEDMLVVMSLDGRVLSGGKPSSEASMHLAAYRMKSGVGAVIHAHSPNIGAFVLARKPIDTRCAPFAYFHLGVIGEVPYLTPGTAELHKAVEERISKFDTLMLYGHGSLALGSDIEDAFVRMDLFEAYAGMLIKVQSLGGVKPLPDDELERITGG